MKWLGFSIWRFDFYCEFKTGTQKLPPFYDWTCEAGSLALWAGRLHISMSLASKLRLP